MKKRKPASSAVTKTNRIRPPHNRPEPSTPAYHPATEQVLSEVEGDNPYLPKRPRQKIKAKKRKPTVTIAPGLRSTRDVFISRPK
jgi:hypothetical protein